MDDKLKKYIITSYQLHDITNGQKKLIEETSADHPFSFITGMGLLIEEFERQLMNLEIGNKFDFALPPEQAFGMYSDEQIVELEKQAFYIDGKFDDKNVYQDAIIPLQDEDGNRFYGRVMEIANDMVKLDLNHPLAGRTLNFSGEIIENREATSEEVSQMKAMLNGQHNHCQCGGHGHKEGCCGNHGHGEGCGHHHHADGECCGKHHQDGDCCGKHHQD
ncbi:MAG: FKBP-type peptidyl-prolyl cis-trans isomerase [Prevotella sp.]